jgi:hydroxyacylglutathione hydrolase
MKLIPLPAFQDNYLWLLHDGQRALVVDPGDAGPVQAFLAEQGLQLTAILVTHHHPDHIGGVDALRDATGAPVFGPARERIPPPYTHLAEGDEVNVLGLRFHVFDVPGHTAGHIAYYCGMSKARRSFSAATPCFPAAAAGCSRERRRRCWIRSTSWRPCPGRPGCAVRTNTRSET